MDYYNKYLKYKNKYLKLKYQSGGVINVAEGTAVTEETDATRKNKAHVTAATLKNKENGNTAIVNYLLGQDYEATGNLPQAIIYYKKSMNQGYVPARTRLEVIQSESYQDRNPIDPPSRPFFGG